MPSIYLKQTGTYGTVTVSEESYKPSNLFKRFKHTPASGNTWKPGEQIKISEKELSMSVLTIKPDGKYAKKELEHSYVYFNKYDPGHRKPLLLSLHFKNEKPESKHIYLQYSEFIFFLRLRSIELSYMTEFENDNELFRVLISENYYTNNSLIYLINRTKDNQDTYNSGTISISQKGER